MTTSTRSSTKKEEEKAAPPASKAEPGSKHKPDPIAGEDEVESHEHDAKRTKPSGEKKQKTLEETINGDEKTEQPKTDESAEQPERSKSKTSGSAVVPGGRIDDDPAPVSASILEKGIIYFFFRGRVNTPEQPSEVGDVARSYILLRPMEKDASLGSGPIGDAGNSRLCAVPKKVLPQSGRERWIAFVEKASASFQTLRGEFLASSEYATKTAGTRHTPAATPIGEGVYAITSTGRESHLVYMLTLPKELGEVQKEIGLRDKGSFIISTKNPEYPGPANARLPKEPKYPDKVLKEFRSLRWLPTQPEHLDYVNTQFLLVGESSGVDKALEPQKEDQEEGNQEPADELDKLMEEDMKRMKSLSKDDSVSIFTDLEARAKNYPKLQTTF